MKNHHNRRMSHHSYCPCYSCSVFIDLERCSSCGKVTKSIDLRGSQCKLCIGSTIAIAKLDALRINELWERADYLREIIAWEDEEF